MERLSNEAERPEFGLVSHTYVAAAPRARSPSASMPCNFREGTLFAYVPATPLAHRDLGIGGPGAQAPAGADRGGRAGSGPAALEPVVVRTAAGRIFRTDQPDLAGRRSDFPAHHGTQGKHAGEGLVCYFFPQPDGNYVWNAVLAAHEIREAMRRVSKAWQSRKGWTTELYLNTGSTRGRSGSAHSDRPPRRVHDAGRHDQPCGPDVGLRPPGRSLGHQEPHRKLSGEERQRLKYGVRRKDNHGQDVFVSSIFSDVDRLADPAASRSERLRDIARLPITEIVDISAPDLRTHGAVGSNSI